MTTFAERILDFNSKLKYIGKLPNNIQVMNPFKDNPIIIKTVEEFYKKYYSDNKIRRMILGINPGRFGAGVTGIPFTDTKRLVEICGLNWKGHSTYEPSSVFVYELIEAYGGAKKFYSDFYINSVSPLGYIEIKNGKSINYNYFDSEELTNAVLAFIVSCIKEQIKFGIDTSVCFCLGKTDNYSFLSRLNDDYHFFQKIVPLDHPRYITQYKKRAIRKYINEYLSEFNK